METDENGDLWVHERDYGANPFGDLAIGLFLIVRGLVVLAMNLFRKRS